MNRDEQTLHLSAAIIVAGMHAGGGGHVFAGFQTEDDLIGAALGQAIALAKTLQGVIDEAMALADEEGED